MQKKTKKKYSINKKQERIQQKRSMITVDNLFR